MSDRDLLAIMAAILYTDVNTLSPKHAVQLAATIIAEANSALRAENKAQLERK